MTLVYPQLVFPSHGAQGELVDVGGLASGAFGFTRTLSEVAGVYGTAGQVWTAGRGMYGAPLAGPTTPAAKGGGASSASATWPRPEGRGRSRHHGLPPGLVQVGLAPVARQSGP